MHIEEDGTITLAKDRAIDACQRAANRIEYAGRDVTRNDRVWHARQPPMPEVNVGATHLGSRRSEKRAARLEIGSIEFAYLDRTPRTGHDGGKDAVTHGVRYPLRAGHDAAPSAAA